MRDDQIVIARASTLTLVVTATVPLVWEVLFHFFGNTPLWVNVHCTNADKNGRLAYFLLLHHMMGPGYLTSQSTRIEETVNSVVHKRGDKGLQVLINALVACWSQVDDNVILGENNPYDDNKFVNILLMAVQHTGYDSMKAVINANPEAAGSFEKAYRILLDHLECTPALQTSPRTIYEIKTGDNRAGKVKGKGAGKRHGQAIPGKKKKLYKDPDCVLDRPTVDRYKIKFKKLYLRGKEA